MNRTLRCFVGLAALFTLAACTPPEPAATSAAPTVATPTATTPPSSASPQTATRMVVVYFGNTVLDPETDCSKVWGVARAVPASEDPLTATMNALLAGPTAAEKASGYTSHFSSQTADALVSAKVSGDTTYVDLKDLQQVIPNASTSCGSAALMAALNTTARQAGGTPRALYAFDGEPKTFWEWLQGYCGKHNDNCDPVPFRS